jgi:hypothetical protein
VHNQYTNWKSASQRYIEPWSLLDELLLLLLKVAGVLVTVRGTTSEQSSPRVLVLLLEAAVPVVLE